MTRIAALGLFALSLAFAAAPLLSPPFSGFRADQLPIAQIDPPIQPAGYAFAIWGVIYAWLIVSAAAGAFRPRTDAAWHAARLPLCVSLAIGVPWIAIAGTSAIWASVTIWLMAGFAIAALLRAPRSDRWLLQTPVALYAGWLTAAACVSLGTVLAGYGVLFGDVVWAALGIALAFGIALRVHSLRRTAPEYLGAVIWALIGIVVANLSTPDSARWAIAALAGAGAAVLALRAAAPQR